MKNMQGYVLLESLFITILWMSLLTGFIYLYDFQQRITRQFEQKAFEYRQLMGFESLFSQWMTSFSTVACLYPLQKHDQTLYLHDLPIWTESPSRLVFYTGRLQLVTSPQTQAKNSWVITQDGTKASKPPFWLFVYEKRVLKMKNDKIYLEHEGHTQMLLDGLKGLRIKMHDGVVELRVQVPHFFKRYRLCQDLKVGLF